jgi:hypothetical protein
MISGKRVYGEGRNRGATVSYGEIERAARNIMANGGRPTVEGVYKALGRGSPNHISTAMQTFWKNQSALNGGDPLALTRLPPDSDSRTRTRPITTTPHGRTWSSCAGTRTHAPTRSNFARRNGTWPRACGNARSPMHGTT